MAKEIILDCDPGIDDALAILFAAAARAELEAITTTAGNVGVEQATRNLLNILQLVNLRPLPQVGKGGALPLCGRLRLARRVHGRDGLGNSHLPPPSLRLKICDAPKVLADTLRAYPGITLIATGPLTNIAELFLKEPQVLDYIGRLVVMGGALRVQGNISRFAEFNIGTDPEAAAVVLGSGVPVEVVSLDVTQTVVLKEEDISVFKKIGTDISEFIMKICAYSIHYHRRNREAEGMYLHDPLAMAVALFPPLGSFEKLPLAVKFQGEERGRIYLKKGAPNASFCRKVDAERFLELFLSKLVHLAKERGRK